MTLSCPSCGAQYNLDESRIPAAGMQLKCPKCGTSFGVTRQGVKPAGGGKVELPGPAGPPKVPAKEPDTLPPEPETLPPVPQTKRRQSSPGMAIPLPGSGPAPAAPKAPAPPKALTPPPPTRAGGAIPLPGTGAPPAPMAAKPAAPPKVAPSTATAPRAPGGAVPLPSGGPAPAPTGSELDPNELFGPGDSEAFDAPPAEPDVELPEVDLPADDSAFQDDPGGTKMVEPPPTLDLGADLGVDVPKMGQSARSGGSQVAQPARPAPVMSRTPTASLEVLDPGQEPKVAPPRAPPSITRSAPKRKFQIQRASGKIFGPFEEDKIAKMLDDGELSGDEQVRQEDGEWEPILGVSIFAAHAPKGAGGRTPSMAAGPGESSQPLGDPEALKKMEQVYGDRMAAMAVVENIPLAEQLRAKLPLIIAGAAIFLLLLAGSLLGLTTYGVFGRFLIFGPPKTSASSEAGKAVAEARAALKRSTYASLKKAAADVARGHTQDRLAVDASGLMAQVGLALAHEAPGEGTSELAAARTAMPEAIDYGPHDQDVLRGQAALAIADQQVAAAHPFLDEALKRQPNQAETLYLQGLAWAPQDKAKAKAALQQALAADPKLLKADIALAELSREAGSLADALGFAQKALEIDPQHPRAKLLVAQLTLASGKNLDPATQEAMKGLADEKQELSRAQRGSALAMVGWAEFRGLHLPQAQKTLEEALKVDPHGRDASLVLARLQLKQHHGAEALTTLTPLTALAAKDSDVADELTTVQIDQGHYAEAAQTVAAQAALHPDNPKLQTLKGIAAASLGKSEEAEKVLLAAVKADPKLSEAHVGLGKLYMTLKQFSKSQSEFATALTQDPQNARAHSAFAELMLAQGDKDAAHRELNTSIALDPDNAEAHMMLGKLLRNLGQSDGSLSELRRAEKLDPKLPGVNVELGELLESRNSLSEAATELRAATVLTPEDALPWRRLGRVLRESGKDDDSFDALSKAANLDSQNSDVHSELALTLLRKSENGKALMEAKTAVEADAKFATAWRTRGRVQLALLAWPDALKDLDKSAELDANSADTHQLRGQALAQLNQLPAAVDAYKRALALDKSRLGLLLEIGQLEAREKKFADALKTYKQALEHDPPLVEAYYLMGRALEESGKMKEAIKYYELATKQESQNAMPFRYLGYYYKGEGQSAKAISAFQGYLKRKPDAEDKSVINDEIGYLKGGD